MIKLFIIFIQLSILVFLGTLIINFSYPVSIALEEVIISTSSSVIIFLLLTTVFLILFFQKILFFIRQKFAALKHSNRNNNYQKGYHAFTQGMIALANKDHKKAILANKKLSKYLDDKSLSLLLMSETLKIEKKYSELEKVYQDMLKNDDTKTLGLKGLMNQSLQEQDYHHAFIYGEKLFNENHQIDKLYETLITIISKTNNWQKLIEINEKSLKNKIIDRQTYSLNQSIAFYEISKIKMHSDTSESIQLMEKALKLREFFPPYVCLYIDLLVEKNKLTLAKKYLFKAWSKNPHPEYKSKIKLLADKMGTAFNELAKYITKDTTSLSESKILLAESLVEIEKWSDAKKIISNLLEHKPSKEVCMLMSKIEEGDTNDPQKVNAWISRSNFGDLNKIWICSITNISQTNWNSVGDSGYFNTLEWKNPKLISDLQPTNVETNIIKYINN
ncbi:MAG: hypothetical protein CFH18_00481 [Alphaproteobacteria bacterium MarineAlpha5_Bin8]|nr:MAG: hypothetical protein CFH17_00128 [Alphaproteobacteria bacterium MarineAlpha5_Bin7]PPR46984.1 MAG: hypothetical protein CFH18_00481 [Alphaproteobacteria bacterium MarineAlpha5_Bin8]PPR54930.1 MAG: hypothetical protein CFH16_00107 [Alphaproteobacteria bacterium MarineAlpha5_Bin6]|tara:strand:- start:4059 stop:5396 length:1338 start_codon:yes stop_codon:yes gene_type:complete